MYREVQYRRWKGKSLKKSEKEKVRTALWKVHWMGEGGKGVWRRRGKGERKDRKKECED